LELAGLPPSMPTDTDMTRPIISIMNSAMPMSSFFIAVAFVVASASAGTTREAQACP
jgi:hypothetical protein